MRTRPAMPRVSKLRTDHLHVTEMWETGKKSTSFQASRQKKDKSRSEPRGVFKNINACPSLERKVNVSSDLSAFTRQFSYACSAAASSSADAMQGARRAVRPTSRLREDPPQSSRRRSPPETTSPRRSPNTPSISAICTSTWCGPARRAVISTSSSRASRTTCRSRRASRRRSSPRSPTRASWWSSVRPSSSS